MGPFPHDAPPATISAANPAGTDGFEFVEFAHPEPDQAGRPVRAHGLHRRRAAQDQGHHRSTARATSTTSSTPSPARSLAASSPSTGPARPPWPGASSCPARLRSCGQAWRRALYRRRQDARCAGHQGHRRLAALFRRQATAPRARPTTASSTGSARPTPSPEGVGFYYLDHLTHNVYRGNMDKWFGFYASLFNFRQIRFFDIEGKHTGLHSRALTSPCGRIRIPINEFGRRQEPDRGIPQELQGRGHPAHRGRHRATLRRRRRAGRQRRGVHARPARDLLRAELRARAWPHASRSRACSGTAS